jgi:hypothetical protein
MPKSDSSFNPADYAPVADRITLFYSRFPNGRILTELISRTDTEIVFKAVIYRSTDETAPASTGWAAERIGDGDINTVACLENTETSAIGRALANLGLTAARARPSLEEMTKAARARVRAARGLTVRPVSSPLHHVSEGQVAPYDPLQYAADRITDTLLLLQQAERSGLPPNKVARIRARLLDPNLTVTHIERVERFLRRFVIAATERRELALSQHVDSSA